MWDRPVLKAKGKVAVKKHWGKYVIVSLILSALTAAEAGTNASSGKQEIQSALDESMQASQLTMDVFMPIFMGMLGIGLVIALLISLLVKNVLIVGCKDFFVNGAQGREVKISQIFHGFSSNYKNIVIAMLLQDIFVSLWSLLFVIPGIIKIYEYRMIPYLLADNPDMSWKDAFSTSKEMMSGNKWKTFILDLSFLGWDILSIITCGILQVLWIVPYKYATEAELYIALKEK